MNNKKNIKSTIKSKIEIPHIQPLQDRILIQVNAESKETKTKFGIIIPASSSEDKNSKKGNVVAVGPGKYEEGAIVPLSVKVGDTVLFQWGEKIQLEENDAAENASEDVPTYYIVRESEILAILN